MEVKFNFTCHEWLPGLAVDSLASPTNTQFWSKFNWLFRAKAGDDQGRQLAARNYDRIRQLFGTL
jgi:hypothetical protein